MTEVSKCSICHADKPDDIPDLLHEHAPCLCGAPMPCDCLNPTIVVRLSIEVRATDKDSMPNASALAADIQNALPDEWTWYPDEHSFRVVEIFDAETVETLNMPSPNEEDRR